MKAQIHPQFVESRFVCSCGNTFVSKSTKPDVRVEVCYKCHPYYTGEHRFLDSKGRVEQFQKKQKIGADMKDTLAAKKNKKEKKEDEGPKTLRELLGEV